MAEYIKKALVAREIRKLLSVRESPVDIFQAGFEYGVNLAWVKIDKIPVADVAPVVHGRWLCVDTDIEQFFLCNRCKKKEYWESNYCPNCGAKMDEEG